MNQLQRREFLVRVSLTVGNDFINNISDLVDIDIEGMCLGFVKIDDKVIDALYQVLERVNV